MKYQITNRETGAVMVVEPNRRLAREAKRFIKRHGDMTVDIVQVNEFRKIVR